MNTLKGSVIRVSLGDCCDNDGYIERVNQRERQDQIIGLGRSLVKGFEDTE